MSFHESAIADVRAAADVLAGKAQGIALLRSVDATESARWLMEIVAALRLACEESEAGPQPNEEDVKLMTLTEAYKARVPYEDWVKIREARDKQLGKVRP